jgi:hypothetical protein
MDDGMFRVADHEYDITYACLELFSGMADNTICWGLKITGKGRDGSDDMSEWQPVILAEELLETKPGQMSHWYEIAGTTLAWDEPNRSPQALFEVDETTAIYKCKWQFVAVPGNSRVRLIFDGMADIDVDHKRIPIHVDALLAIAPWPMARRSERECLDLYQRLGLKDPVEFRLQPHSVSSLVVLNQ